jgi:hypothetical protein
VADPAAPRRQGLCDVRRGELRHPAQADLHRRRTRLHLRQFADRLLRLRRNPGVDPGTGAPIRRRSTPRTARAPASPAASLADGRTLRDAYLDGSPTNAAAGAVSGSPCTNLATYANGKLVPKSTSGQGFTHKLNLTWKPSEDLLLYATWSSGFRPGGINRRGDVTPYATDVLTNYELGWKTTLADGMLRFNGAIYQQELEGLPILLPRREQLHRSSRTARTRASAASRWTPITGWAG